VIDRFGEQLKSAFPADAITRVQVLEFGDDPQVEPERPRFGSSSIRQAAPFGHRRGTARIGRVRMLNCRLRPMSSPSAAGLGNPQVISVVPILRMYDVAATIRFYADYLGCSLDHQAGAGDRPVYLQVSGDGMQLHLSSHHDDGTPGTAVLVEVRDIDALHAELHQRGYPFFNPGISSGAGGVKEMQLIDPASNRIRFYEPAPAS
jgi:catechol 2,3-dioxygenase-like lactoylglutathione lyase family enzyme